MLVLYSYYKQNEPACDKTNKMTCAQRGTQISLRSIPSLIRIFAALMEEALGLWLPLECTAKTDQTGQVILLVLSSGSIDFHRIVKNGFLCPSPAFTFLACSFKIIMLHLLHSKNFFSSVCLDQIPWDYKNDHLSLIWIFLLILYHISKRNNSL